MKLSERRELECAALCIRRNMVREFSGNHGGHIGGSLDLAEMLAVVYSDFLRLRVDEPDWVDRDFMVFSKGHAGAALYAALAWKGVLPAERLDWLNNENSLLPGHCDRIHVPGVDATTGSLGQGVSIACGAALGAKLRKSGQRVFCVTGDGESAEGQIWEAAQFAAHYRLDNLIAFLDWNKRQIDGTTDGVLSLGDPAAKYTAFGWNAETIDGHDVLAIQTAVLHAVEKPNGKPTMIVLDTVKGHGLSFVEAMDNNHCIGFSEMMSEQAATELAKQADSLGVELNGELS